MHRQDPGGEPQRHANAGQPIPFYALRGVWRSTERNYGARVFFLLSLMGASTLCLLCLLLSSLCLLLCLLCLLGAPQAQLGQQDVVFPVSAPRHAPGRHIIVLSGNLCPSGSAVSKLSGKRIDRFTGKCVCYDDEREVLSQRWLYLLVFCQCMLVPGSSRAHLC